MVGKTLWLVSLAVVLALTAGCDQGTGDEQEDASSAVPIAIGDGEWDFRADRAFYQRPGVARIPSDTLTEADFRLLSEGPTYRVVVSEAGSRVSIRGVLFEDDLVEGRRAAATDGRIEYDLGEIAGGGRFVVWSADGAVQAELAVYGSGMPFLRCVRGVLVCLP